MGEHEFETIMNMAVHAGPTTAAERFFDITELLEIVLLYLPVQCLVIAIMAGKRMHHVILGSQLLRDRLGIRKRDSSDQYADHACVLIREIMERQPGHIALRLRWDLSCVQHLLLEHVEVARALGWYAPPTRRYFQGILSETLWRLDIHVALRVPFLPAPDETPTVDFFREIVEAAISSPDGLEDRLGLDFLRTPTSSEPKLMDRPHAMTSTTSRTPAPRVYFQPRSPLAKTEVYPHFCEIFRMSRWLCVPVTRAANVDWEGYPVPSHPSARPGVKIFAIQDENGGEHEWPLLEGYDGELWAQMNVTLPPRDIIVYPVVTDQLGGGPFFIPHTQATMGNLLNAIEARARPSYCWDRLSERKRYRVEEAIGDLLYLRWHLKERPHTLPAHVVRQVSLHPMR